MRRGLAPRLGLVMALLLFGQGLALFAGAMWFLRDARFDWAPMSPDQLAPLVGYRVLIFVGVMALVTAVVLLPLVRRIRVMADQTERIVAQDFHGSLDPGRDDELGDLARAFNAVTEAARGRMEELQRRDRVLRDLLADVAHDVRTPLTSLQMGLRQALGDGVEPRLASAIRADLAHLEGMFDNLASVIQLEGSSIPLSRTRLSATEVVQRVGLRFELLGRAQGIEVHTSLADEPVFVYADPIALEQALGNLVGNAVRFASGNVAIVLTSHGSRAVISVRDDGPGVAIEDIPRLRERRYRGRESHDDGRSGTGLGLAIAHEIALRHEGTVELARHPEGGTVATLEIPRVD